MKCYKAFSRLNEFFDNGSTGGVATTLAYFLLMNELSEGVLVSDEDGTYVARTKDELLKSCGSKYHDLPYVIPAKVHGIAQIGKPCDMNNFLSPRISLFCSRLFGKEPISKKELRSWSRPKRFLKGLMNRPLRCWGCPDHLGRRADISCGDSQYNSKVNVVIVWNELGDWVWNNCVEKGLIHSEGVSLGEIKKKQPYLWSVWRFLRSR